jgi:hypothetical protein
MSRCVPKNNHSVNKAAYKHGLFLRQLQNAGVQPNLVFSVGVGNVL